MAPGIRMRKVGGGGGVEVMVGGVVILWRVCVEVGGWGRGSEGGGCSQRTLTS